jgi:hypothetical protein
MYEKLPPPNPEMKQVHEDNREEQAPARRRILDPDIARKVSEFRDREFPLGFRNVNELLDLEVFTVQHLDTLQRSFSNRFFGSWSIFPQDIPRRGPGDYDGVVHAALLHTGKVLFITADETTLLWNPEDTTPATFEDPLNQPHLTPDAASGYSVLCCGHSFLSDGRLLVAGGGGYGPHDKAIWGYKFDPTNKSWTRTTGSMVHHRWYPTVLTLGDRRIGDSREVMVVCGHGAGDMEIYDEASDSFREVTSGDTKPFPNLYPGLHLLPNSSIFYSRTGWASAGPGGGPFTGDDQSAYFVLAAASNGSWTDIAPVMPSMPDRTKGMSVMLLSSTAPHVRIMVLGGSDSSNNNSYEIIDATSLSQQRSGAQPHRSQMVNAGALEVPSCYPMAMYSYAGASKDLSPPARYSIHEPIRGRRWQRCPPSGITTRSRCSCRVVRWRWRDGTTRRLKSSIHPICTVERGQ